MMHIPSINNKLMTLNQFNINLSSEIVSSSQRSSALSINTINKLGYEYGLSTVSPINPNNSIELGFHIQKKLLSYGDININIGIQDILYRQGSDSTNGLDTKGISLFTVLNNESKIDQYNIITHLGIGSGKINSDSHFNNNYNQNINVFLGFEFNTPYLKKNGGISFLTEFDGSGLNIGLRIPILRLYQLNLGITNFEIFGDYATEDKEGSEYSKMTENAPSIVLGLNLNIPKIKNDINQSEGYIGDGIYAKTDTSILYYDPICTEIVLTLRDSIRLTKNQADNLEDKNIMLLHNNAILNDSTRSNLLKLEINQSKQNEAMRHLSRSLRFFYNENYRDALSEINFAIDANPNLAIAYGRRGSIYYKLGDKRRATLNWNVALQIDPEFTEIYDILKASEENRINPVKISKNIGENK